MSMNKEEWENGIVAWTKVRDQALLDVEQAELYISAIKIKIKEIKK